MKLSSSIFREQWGTSMETKTILIIPDPHDEPGVDKERFKWAGRMIVDKQPDTVVCLGDGATMDSLSQYDVGSLISEGRRYSDDIGSFNQAFDLLHAPIVKYNDTSVRFHKKKYKPRYVYTLGNHEQRIYKAINKDPRLAGTLSVDHLNLKERGWEVYPLTVPVDVYGIAVAHYFTSGIMGKAISGINHARSLVAKTYVPTVVGHSHDRSFWEDTDVFGRKIIGLVAGCFFEHELCYTTEEDRNWPGIVMLAVEGKTINPSFISMDEVRKEYA